MVGVRVIVGVRVGFSALQRAEIAEILEHAGGTAGLAFVSVLFNEPKLLKFDIVIKMLYVATVSVLFNEPKLLKFE